MKKKTNTKTSVNYNIFSYIFHFSFQILIYITTSLGVSIVRKNLIKYLRTVLKCINVQEYLVFFFFNTAFFILSFLNNYFLKIYIDDFFSIIKF